MFSSDWFSNRLLYYYYYIFICLFLWDQLTTILSAVSNPPISSSRSLQYTPEPNPVTLKLQAPHFFETSGSTYEHTRRHNPEDSHLSNIHHYKRNTCATPSNSCLHAYECAFLFCACAERVYSSCAQGWSLSHGMKIQECMYVYISQAFHMSKMEIYKEVSLYHSSRVRQSC